MLTLESTIIIAGIWISCGIYAHGKKSSDALFGALILTVIIWLIQSSIPNNGGIIILILLILFLLIGLSGGSEDESDRKKSYKKQYEEVEYVEVPADMDPKTVIILGLVIGSGILIFSFFTKSMTIAILGAIFYVLSLLTYIIDRYKKNKKET